MSDWDTVTILKKKPLKAAQMKTEAAINQARKLISLESEKQFYFHVFIYKQDGRASTSKLIRNVSDSLSNWLVIFIQHVHKSAKDSC